MYIYNLGNIDTMIYFDANIGGAYHAGRSRFDGFGFTNWHYTGSFYWIKQHILNNGRHMITNKYYVTEAFPGLICRNMEKCLVFFRSHCGKLYDKENHHLSDRTNRFVQFQLSKI
jgi:hypothetical protein